MSDLYEWEEYGYRVKRMKVDGGWIYKSGFSECFAMCFVPEIDLTRYQSHLRDAYNQGFKDGQDSKSFYNAETTKELPKGLPGQVLNREKHCWEFPEVTL